MRAKDEHDKGTTLEFVRGGTASFINILVTFPINKLMFRQQLEGLTITEAYSSLRADGIKFLYRGVLPPLASKSLSMSFMFGAYDWYAKQLMNFQVFRTHSNSSQPTMMAEVCAALLAGSTEGLLAPLERAQTLLQTPHFHEHYENTWDALKKLRPYGFSEYYRTPLRDVVPAFDSSATSRFIQNFTSGAILGATISTLFFPINTAKTIMQRQVGGKHHGIWSTLKHVYRERQGIRGLFAGVHVNFTRSLVSWGIINAMFEWLKNYDEQLSDMIS